jgi:hypothetical protein
MPNAIATPHAKLLHATLLVAACKVLPDITEFKAKSGVAATMNNCTKSDITKKNHLKIFTLCLLNVVIEKNTYIVIKLCLFNVLIFRNYFVFSVTVFI